MLNIYNVINSEFYLYGKNNCVKYCAYDRQLKHLFINVHFKCAATIFKNHDALVSFLFWIIKMSFVSHSFRKYFTCTIYQTVIYFLVISISLKIFFSFMINKFI